MDIIEKLRNREELLWLNPAFGVCGMPADAAVSYDALDEAQARLRRFAPYFARRFPETAVTGGFIDSPLAAAPGMKAALEKVYGAGIEGGLYIKCDSELAVSGSVKARGGIYEVLCRAEEIAQRSGMLDPADDYSVLCGERFARLFGCYTLSVGSTGNLGLSVGIMGAALGFRVTVHMSADAKAWKKALLRSRGVDVVEHGGDYGSAVAAGRECARNDRNCFFIDDENSYDLFYGYAAAAERFAAQLRSASIEPSGKHPVAVYLPCGVGTSPAGIAYGLHRIFGDGVLCFFCEPVSVPSMLLGMITGKHGGASVYDIGLDGITAADGLACSSPSVFAGRVMEPVLRGIFTVKDDELFRCLALLWDSEGMFCEPSACIGFAGAARLPHNIMRGIAAHIVWTTGGSMVPDGEREEYIKRGRELL